MYYKGHYRGCLHSTNQHYFLTVDIFKYEIIKFSISASMWVWPCQEYLHFIICSWKQHGRETSSVHVSTGISLTASWCDRWSTWGEVPLQSSLPVRKLRHQRCWSPQKNGQECLPLPGLLQICLRGIYCRHCSAWIQNYIRFLKSVNLSTHQLLQ